MIRAVFFDLGKVLVDFNLDICVQKLARTSGREVEEIKSLLFTPRMHEFERGRLTGQEFLGEIHAAIKYPDTLESMIHAFNDIFSIMPDNVALLERISQKFPVGLVSNTNHLHAEFVESRYSFPSLFTKRIYSQETGYRKPEPEIFQVACEALGTEPGESLFIDDLLSNIQGARNLGFHTIHLETGRYLAAELRRFPELAPFV
ncbi:MAG: HAD family phosphatase [Leptospirales bacterium]|nr:HAD family phosphatase [Leptospirales bacterium]